MQLAEMKAAQHDQAAPDRRRDPDERDADLQRDGFSQVHAGKYAGIGDN